MSTSEMNVIYMRTEKGQALAPTRKALHDEKSHVVLRLVNGYTPSGHLATLVKSTIPDAQIRLEDLEKKGLIERVSGTATKSAVQFNR